MEHAAGHTLANSVCPRPKTLDVVRRSRPAALWNNRLVDRRTNSFVLEGFAPELALLTWAARRAATEDRAMEGAGEGGAEASEGDSRVAALVAAVTGWDLFVRLAARHGMAPLVARSVRERPEAWFGVPEDVRDRLAATARGNVIRCLRLGSELIQVLRICADSGVEVMPLKGPVLAQEAYGDLALRQISDLDVLVRPEQVVRAVEVVMGAGYAPLATMGSGEARYSLRSGQDIVFQRRASRAGGEAAADAGTAADAEAADAGPGTFLVTME